MAHLNYIVTWQSFFNNNIWSCAVLMLLNLICEDNSMSKIHIIISIFRKRRYVVHYNLGFVQAHIEIS